MISKKLIIFNITALLLLFSSQIVGNYLINYPMKFYWSNAWENSGFLPLFIILGSIVLISWLISHLKIRNFSFINKFLLIFGIFCFAFFCFITIYSFSIFFKTKKEMGAVAEKYVQQAKKDIKNSLVNYKYAGGLTILKYDKRTYEKIDSIRKNYGIIIDNTGCQVDLIEKEGQIKYEGVVNPYLEKRNGKGWEKRMRNEMEIIKESAPKKNN
jgi:hypothetical protein